MTYVIATSKRWSDNLTSEIEAQLNCQFIVITDPSELSVDYLESINAKVVFFPYWSWVIDKEIYEKIDCVIFHMTDLPYGRGGSPLQNLISRNIYETKISALKCIAELDAGPIYTKRPLSLYGTAQEIFIRANSIIQEVIVSIIKDKLIPIPQSGEPVFFKRRTPNEGNIAELQSLGELFDWIRMLDAEDYPNAFVDVGRFRFEFKRASLCEDHIISDVKIKVIK